MDEELKAFLAAMEGRLRAHMSTLIEGVHTSLGAIREDIVVIGAAGDRMRRAGENTRDETRDVAASLASIERVLLQHGTRLDALERKEKDRP